MQTILRFPCLFCFCLLYPKFTLKKRSRKAGVKLLRTKYNKWLRRYISYAKMRRKTTKKKKRLRRALLQLLHKINNHLCYLGIFTSKDKKSPALS